MAKFDFRNVEKIPGKCGGRATIVGTRIRVAMIRGWYRMGMTVEEIVQQYPSIRPSDVHDALAYAYEHAEEIDDDVAADEEVVAKNTFKDSASS